MDYKEKYEKALANARKLYNEAKAIGYTSDMEDYETIFPELAESKDEKMKQELIKYFTGWQTDNLFRGYTAEEWIAWIEKQGEQMPVVPKFKVGDKVRLKGSCGWYNVTEIRDSEYYLTSNDVVPCLLPIYEQDNWELVLQNPDWSEEDENRINRLIAYFEDKESFTAEDGIVYANWLKSLRPQPKQEWNYNDEIIIGTIIQEIEKIPSEKFIDNAKYRCLDWLRYRTKSLRPQNT